MPSSITSNVPSRRRCTRRSQNAVSIVMGGILLLLMLLSHPWLH